MYILDVNSLVQWCHALISSSEIKPKKIPHNMPRAYIFSPKCCPSNNKLLEQICKKNALRNASIKGIEEQKTPFLRRKKKLTKFSSFFSQNIGYPSHKQKVGGLHMRHIIDNIQLITLISLETKAYLSNTLVFLQHIKDLLIEISIKHQNNMNQLVLLLGQQPTQSFPVFTKIEEWRSKSLSPQKTFLPQNKSLLQLFTPPPPPPNTTKSLYTKIFP